jgi:hypothetical protein
MFALGLAHALWVLILSPSMTTLDSQQAFVPVLAGLLLLHVYQDDRFLTRVGGSLLYVGGLTACAAYFAVKDVRAGYVGKSLTVGVINTVVGVATCFLAALRKRRTQANLP